MGRITFGTIYPADFEVKYFLRLLKITEIITMDSKTAGMFTARTFKLMKLDRIDKRIIYFLRKMVAVFEEDCYHGNT